MPTLPTGEEKQKLVRDMFDTIASRYDFVNKLMTFGLDARWRSRAVTLLGLRPGSVVLDLACGTGDLCRELSWRGHHAVGVDLSRGMLRHAWRGVPLLQADAALLPLRKGAVDGVVSGFALRNFADLKATLGELGRVLRPDGRLSFLEVSEPASPLLRAGHAVWFRHVVPLIGAALSDAASYRYLPESVSYLPSTAEMDAMLEAAGFGDTRRYALSGGIVQILTATQQRGRGRKNDAA